MGVGEGGREEEGKKTGLKLLQPLDYNGRHVLFYDDNIGITISFFDQSTLVHSAECGSGFRPFVFTATMFERLYKACVMMGAMWRWQL